MTIKGIPKIKILQKNKNNLKISNFEHKKITK